MRYPDQFINDILDKADWYDAKVIIPVHEETYILSKYKDVLYERGIRIAIEDPSKIINLNNKSESTALAQHLGIPVPHTWAPHSVEEMCDLAKEIRYPAVIKLRKGRGTIGLQYVNDASSLQQQFRRTVSEFSLDDSNLPLIQEYIQGKGVGVSMILNHGETLAKFVHERCREFPASGGTSTERISIRFPEAEEYAQRLLSHLKWHGVAMVEFKVEERTQKPYFLEVNPRFWGSLNQAVSSGVDFPYLLYKLALNEDIQPVLDYELGVRSIWFFGYLRALLDDAKQPRRWGDILTGAAHLLNSRDTHFDDLSLHDPLPTIVEPLFALKQLFTKGKLTFETEEELVKNVPF